DVIHRAPVVRAEEMHGRKRSDSHRPDLDARKEPAADVERRGITGTQFEGEGAGYGRAVKQCMNSGGSLVLLGGMDPELREPRHLLAFGAGSGEGKPARGGAERASAVTCPEMARSVKGCHLLGDFRSRKRPHEAKPGKADAASIITGHFLDRLAIAQEIVRGEFDRACPSVAHEVEADRVFEDVARRKWLQPHGRGAAKIDPRGRVRLDRGVFTCAEVGKGWSENRFARLEGR